MIDSVRGLPGVYNILSPAAYRAQENAGSENATPHLHRSQSESGGVRITLSQEALALVRGDTEKKQNPQNQAGETGAGQGNRTAGETETGEERGLTGETELSEEDQRQVEELKSRDREVRAHEQAHLAAAGGLATSGASYEYQTGPDGKRYAIGGEVNISVSEGNTPEQTIQNAQQAQHAALAPANPSAQDRKVAADAAAMAAEARQEQAQQGSETAQGSLASGVKKTMEIIGRQAFAFQSQMERGYQSGMSFSVMNVQA